jgi:2-acylglycerol O-acyltransferase 2
MRDYFPAKLIKMTQLDPERNYILGYHPHGTFPLFCSNPSSLSGIISTGLWINFCTEASDFAGQFPGIRLHPMTLNANLRLPFWREFLMAHGLCSVSKKSFANILNGGSGNSVILVPGGAREALDAHPGTNDLTLFKRKGFIKMALVNGYVRNRRHIAEVATMPFSQRYLLTYL